MRSRLKAFIDKLPKPATQWGRRFSLGLLVGVLAGLAASAMECGIHFGSKYLVSQFTHLGESGILQFNPGIVMLPTLGGLLAGSLVVFLCKNMRRGHGVDQVTKAFHHNMGRLPLKTPLVKSAGAAMIISCGGSVGPEGPIAALGGAIGSWLSRFFPITAHERRILLIAGCAAGVGAIFRCPLGGALFASSILYYEPDFESDAIVTSVIASVIGYSVFMLFWGIGEPLLKGVKALTFQSPVELLPYALLGPLCALTGIFFVKCFHRVEALAARQTRLPPWALPGAGCFVAGFIACIFPQVMDGRYAFIQHALDGTLFAHETPINWLRWAVLFLAIAWAKCIATALTVGSGAPGGVLGPSVFIGGALGASLGAVCEAMMPGSFPEPLRESLIAVGMGGVLSATMRTPLASIVMVTEMTGSYGLIVPLMLVCITSYMIGRRSGFNAEVILTAADSPTHAADNVIHLLDSWRVESLMDKKWDMTITPDTPLKDIVARIQPGTRPVFAVAQDNQLLGLISIVDISFVLDGHPQDLVSMIAADVMSEKLVSIQSDDSVHNALRLFKQSTHEVLPVYLDGGDKKHWVGMLRRKRIVKALYKQIQQMHQFILQEHEELASIEGDLQLHQIALQISPLDVDSIQHFFVPRSIAGKSLRESDFRKQFGLQVLAMEGRDGHLEYPPNLDKPLEANQKLLVIGKKDGQAH